MIKRILSFVMAVLLLVGMIPLTAVAEERKTITAFEKLRIGAVEEPDISTYDFPSEVSGCIEGEYTPVPVVEWARSDSKFLAQFNQNIYAVADGVDLPYIEIIENTSGVTFTKGGVYDLNALINNALNAPDKEEETIETVDEEISGPVVVFNPTYTATEEIVDENIETLNEEVKSEDGTEGGEEEIPFMPPMMLLGASPTTFTLTIMPYNGDTGSKTPDTSFAGSVYSVKTGSVTNTVTIDATGYGTLSGLSAGTYTIKATSLTGDYTILANPASTSVTISDADVSVNIPEYKGINITSTLVGTKSNLFRTAEEAGDTYVNTNHHIGTTPDGDYVYNLRLEGENKGDSGLDYETSGMSRKASLSKINSVQSIQFNSTALKGLQYLILNGYPRTDTTSITTLSTNFFKAGTINAIRIWVDTFTSYDSLRGSFNFNKTKAFASKSALTTAVKNAIVGNSSSSSANSDARTYVIELLWNAYQFATSSSTEPVERSISASDIQLTWDGTQFTGTVPVTSVNNEKGWSVKSKTTGITTTESGNNVVITAPADFVSGTVTLRGGSERATSNLYVYYDGEHQGVGMGSGTNYITTTFNVTTPTYSTGQLKIIKSSANSSVTSGNSDYSLENATYELYSDSGLTTLVATLVTDVNGEATTSAIPAGTYWLKETIPSQGYLVNTDSMQIEVIGRPSGTYTVVSDGIMIETPAIGYKIDVYTTIQYKNRIITQTLAGQTVTSATVGYISDPGATVELYAKADILDADGDTIYHSGDLVASGTSDSTGHIIFNNLLAGEYTVNETALPVGYYTNANDVTISSDDATTTYSTTMRKIQKQFNINFYCWAEVFNNGSITTQKSQSFIYGLYNRNDITVGTTTTTATIPADTLIYAAESSATGRVNLLARFGEESYYVKTISIPEGYILSDTEYDVTPAYDASNTATIQSVTIDPITNYLKKATIKITTIDSDSHSIIPASGATFEIRDTDGNLIETVSSNETGIATSSSIPYGTYTITETIAPAGYATTSAQTVTLDDGTITEGVLNVDFDHSVSQSSLILTVHGNKYTGLQTIEKSGYSFSSITYADSSLGSTSFSLYAKDNIVVGGVTLYNANELIETDTTNGIGSITFSNLYPGNYYIVENSAMSTDYVLNTNHIDVTIPSTSSIATSNDLRSTSIEFDVYVQPDGTPTTVGETTSMTYDSDHSNYLLTNDSFIFGLYTKSSITIDGVTIPADTLIDVEETNNGHVEFSGYYPGGTEYYVQELVAPSKYLLSTNQSSDIDVIPLDLSNSTSEVIISDTYVDLNLASIGVSSLDKNNALPLGDSTFKVYDSANNEIWEQTTDSSGEFTMVLVPGQYTLVETIAPAGYMQLGTTIPFTVNHDRTATYVDETGSTTTGLSIKVPNEPNPTNVILPSTGSNTSICVSVFGIVTLLAAIVYRKKKQY